MSISRLAVQVCPPTAVVAGFTVVYTVAAGHKLELREIVMCNQHATVTQFVTIRFGGNAFFERSVPAQTTLIQDLFQTLPAGSTISLNTGYSAHFVTMSGIDVFPV